MANISVSNSRLGSALADLLLCDDLEPGDDISYQNCKTLYLYHPLGEKMVDAPIKAAQSQQRIITVPKSPEDIVVKAFVEEAKRIKEDHLVANSASIARIYGVGALVMGAVDVPSNVPIKPEDLWKLRLFFNVADPLNTSGSIILNQDPNSPEFQNVGAIAVAGQVYHPSRRMVLMNGNPIYIAYTTSGFGYVGRSVYQRAFFPMKTFIQSMITDDMVTTKVGLLIAKLRAAGSIIDNMMQGFAALKRQMLSGARTGNVLSIDAGTTTTNAEEIETLNMQNVDKAGGWARGNVLKNIATAADMPAVMLENETLTEGFGEGSEDAKIIARYIDGIREWLQPGYDFLDPIIMRRAWNPEFYKTVQALYPDEYGDVDYTTAFYQWANSFSAEWPSLLKEPESEEVKVQETKSKTIISVVETFSPLVDPENMVAVLLWAADNLNDNKTMFGQPLLLDQDALLEHLQAAEEQKKELAAAGMTEPGADAGDGEGKKKPPLRLASS